MGPAVTDRVHNETELIETYLAPLTRGCAGAFGLKDDAALIEVDAGTDLVISTDPIIAGVHFFATDDAADIAWKALAVNVSDLVAKGAEPVGYTMALAFPEAPERAWMGKFASGLRAAQEAFGLTLVGGDTDRTSGPLSISVTAFGAVPREAFVPRNGARPGDRVFVSGTLGDAALGLKLHWDPSFIDGLSADHRQRLISRYLRPEPRLALIPVLRRFATAALDVSDGFAKDLARLAGGAHAGIDVPVSRLPLSEAARSALSSAPEAAISAALSGGDDYEVIFAVTDDDAAALESAARIAGVAITEIGALGAGVALRFIADNGTEISLASLGYDHFS